jgi:nucleotide-binding universal stress UspA family protein
MAGPIRRVVAAIDPRPAASDVDALHLAPPADPVREALVRKILGTAAAGAATLGAELHAVHAWAAPGEELLRGETFLSADQVRDYVAAAREARRAAFDRAIDDAGLDIPAARRHLEKGPGEDVILGQAAGAGPALVVIGTVARGGLGALLGSTAEAVARHAPCSVLVVRPDADDAPTAGGA